MTQSRNGDGRFGAKGGNLIGDSGIIDVRASLTEFGERIAASVELAMKDPHYACVLAYCLSGKWECECEPRQDAPETL